MHNRLCFFYFWLFRVLSQYYYPSPFYKRAIQQSQESSAAARFICQVYCAKNWTLYAIEYNQTLCATFISLSIQLMEKRIRVYRRKEYVSTKVLYAYTYPLPFSKGKRKLKSLVPHVLTIFIRSVRSFHCVRSSLPLLRLYTIFHCSFFNQFV